MKKRVLVPLAGGFEEIEAIAVIDILRRAGVEVLVAGREGAGPVSGRCEVVVVPDAGLHEALDQGPFDAVVLPGGMDSTLALRDDPRVIAALQEAAGRGALVAAICAAPMVLHRAGLLGERACTSHPGVADELPVPGYSDKRVVVAQNMVTSRAPGTAVEFALELARILCGPEIADGVAADILA